MSSSNTIKVKYSNTYNFPISLSEYLLCEDDGLRQVIFKFYNGVNQNVNEFSFTISEYDSANKLIKTSRINVKGTYGMHQLFIPKSKFLMNSETKYIKYTLVYAKFDKLTYNEGKYYRPNVILDVKDETVKSREAKTDKLSGKDKKQLITHSFLVTSLNEKYRAKGSSVFVGILATLMLIFSFVLVYTYKTNTNVVDYSGINYSMKLELNEADKTCTIIQYDGNTSELEINDEYYGFRLNKISNNCFYEEEITSLRILGNNEIFIDFNAFALSKLQTVESEAKLSIAQNVFNGCVDLHYVNLPNATMVDTGAFAECYNLCNVNLSKANCARLSFENCQNLHELFIGDTSATRFSELFTKDTYYYSNLMSVGYFSQTIDRGFFDCLGYLDNFSYNPNAFVDYNALPNSLQQGGEFSGLK